MRTGPFLLGLATVLAARGAAAEQPPFPAMGAMPALSAVPEGHVPAMPSRTPPASIRASERVPDFRGKVDPAEDVCFVDSDNAPAPEEEEVIDGVTPLPARPREWPTQGMTRESLDATLSSRPTPGKGVRAFHAERLAVSATGAASLEIADAWIDLGTRGARLIARAHVPLARVFAGPNGVEVYAARDADALQIVIRAGTKVSDDAGVSTDLLPSLRSLSVSLPDGGDGNSQCGHLRFALHASADLGETATLRSTAFLPPLDDEPPPAAAAEGESAEEITARLLGSMRARSYQLTVSATQTSADAAPVLSVSAGWVGRERRGVFGGEG